MNDYENIPVVSQPKGLHVNLYKHQLAMIYKMERLEQEKLVQTRDCIQRTSLGVNANISGHGKTLSMLGMILRDKMDWDLEIPYVHEDTKTEAAGIIIRTQLTRYIRLRTNLILVSSSVIGQWEKELKKTDLKYSLVKTNRDIPNVEAEEYDVVLIIPSMFNKYVASYSNCAWKRFIFDEPSHVKVPGMKSIKAGFYWFVTATPNLISAKHRNCRNSFMQSIVGEGWWDFDVQFAGMVLKNDDNFVRASFNMPKTHYHDYECFNPVMKALNGMVNEHIIEMLEYGDVGGAITELGGTKTENILELVRKNKKDELNKILLAINSGFFKEKEIKELEEKRDKINNQLFTLEERFNRMLEENCCICSEKLNGPVLEPNCQNLFCGNCLLTWFKTKPTCPLCRNIVDTSKLIYLAEKKDTPQPKGLRRLLTKNERIIDIIENSKGGKILIYSSFSETFGSICKLLLDNQISFAEIRGSVKTRQQCISKFKDGNIKVLFLNSNYNGAGIDLQVSTDLILYHEMPYDLQMQIIGRANRIGREKELHVHRLQVKL